MREPETYFVVMNEALRVVLMIFFATHIPITLLIDMQAIFGSFYPSHIREFFLWYGEAFNDPLMSPMKGGGDQNKAWLHSFIWSESLFQLPFFFYAVHSLNNRAALKDIQFLVWSLVYGVHVSTTVMPIMATFLVSNEVNAKEMCILVSIYAPYLLLPLSLATYSARELLSTRSSTEKKVE